MIGIYLCVGDLSLIRMSICLVDGDFLSGYFNGGFWFGFWCFWLIA